MNNVPNIISTKDLTYIEDILNWNYILIKKINHYLTEIKDQDVVNSLDKAFKMLLNNYNDILSTLE